MHFVTVATHSERYFPVLKESCKRNKIHLEILGEGEEYTGHYMKDDLMLQYLTDLKDDEIVCFLDAFDTVCLQSEKEIKQKFLDTKKNLIISLDNKINWRSHPIGGWYYSKIFKECKGEYLNSGLYIGYVWCIKQFLEKSLKYRSVEHNSNQRTWIDYCIAKPDDFCFDKKRELFVNFVRISQNPNVEIKNKKLNIRMDTQSRNANGGRDVSPSFISGPASYDMNYMLKKLGYKNLPEMNYLLSPLNVKKFFKNYAKIFIFELIIIFLLLLIVAVLVLKRIRRL